MSQNPLSSDSSRQVEWRRQAAISFAIDIARVNSEQYTTSAGAIVAEAAIIDSFLSEGTTPPSPSD